jgi:glycosyltransferase involved in cell wall biosynthesis
MNAPLTEESRRWRKLAFDDISMAVERAALREADGVVVVSEPLADRCLDLGLARNRILLLSNGVDTGLFFPGSKDNALAAKLGLKDARVVGFAGSLKPWHGVDLLLEAFSTLAEKDAGLRLLVVGDGPERTRLEDSAAHAGETERVVFTGTVPHARMPDYFRLMDVAAAPYRAEGGGYFSPLKVLEAMACGLPVVASGGGDLFRQIDPGRSGVLVPAGDTGELGRALDRLLNDPGLRSRMGAAARAQAELRTWTDNARRLTAFLAERMEAG